MGVARSVRFGLWVISAVGVACALVLGAGARASAGVSVRVTVGPTRLLSPGFGYSVAYRTVEGGTTAQTAIALFVYDHGRWRNATPPMLRADGINAIDAVDFVDRRHGWVAAYNCATTAVYLYRTSDGGRSWQSLGKPSWHSCGGGPTFLSFVDDRHGWMEPVSPNGPVGELLETSDAGRTWRHLLSGPASQVRSAPALPCLAPISFTSLRKGWMARCERGGVSSTVDGGRHWRTAAIRIPDVSEARFDLPWFRGSMGVVAATLGTRPPSESGRMRKVVFSVSHDGGRNWTDAAARRIASCPLDAYYTPSWPTSIVDERTWWVVADGNRPMVQVTTDAGHTWRTVAERGLPVRWCSLASVSAASPQTAWVVVRDSTTTSALFRTVDGGRRWQRVILLRK